MSGPERGGPALRSACIRRNACAGSLTDAKLLTNVR